MPVTHKEKALSFGGPATYQIIVQGRLDGSWSDRLGGMVITHDTAADERVRTHLTGLIKDQAELAGILEVLHSLHLSIVRVEQINNE